MLTAVQILLTKKGYLWNDFKTLQDYKLRNSFH